MSDQAHFPESRSAERSIALQFDCSLKSVRPFHAELSAAFKMDRDITIDCAALSRCDLTTVQLLVSACKTADVASRRLRIVGATEALLTALTRSGLSLSPAGDRIQNAEA